MPRPSQHDHLPANRLRQGACLLGTAVLALVVAGCGSTGAAPDSFHAADFTGTGGARAELRPPDDGGAPRGLLVLVHGGAWKGVDPQQFQAARAVAGGYRRLGYGTLAVEYRRGAAGLSDIERFYDRARRVVGAKVPVCAIGSSAGGNLALMLAVRRSSVGCVISLAGPTDLTTLGEGRGEVSRAVAVQQFGADRLRAFSPALHADRIRAKLLLAFASNDPYVPPSQGTELAKRKPGTRLVILPPGNRIFAHSYVDPEKMADLQRLELQFLEQNTR